MTNPKPIAISNDLDDKPCQPKVEFWDKDGYWHYLEPTGKWSADCFECSADAWKASNEAWELAHNCQKLS